MSLYPPLCEFVEVDKKDVTVFSAGSSEDEVFGVVAQRNYVVPFIFLKGKGGDDVLNLHAEQIHNKYFVAQGYRYLSLPHSDLHDVGLETQVCYDSLSVSISTRVQFQ